MILNLIVIQYVLLFNFTGGGVTSGCLSLGASDENWANPHNHNGGAIKIREQSK